MSKAKVLVAEVKEEEQQLEEEVNEASVIVSAKTAQYFTPAQDFIDGSMFYLVYLETVVGKRPFIVTSLGELIPFTEEDLANRGLIIPSIYKKKKKDEIILIPPKDQLRWSIGSKELFNVHSYLKEGVTVDPFRLYEKIHSKFTTYLDYPDKRFHTFMSVYSMETYVYMIFDACPYVLFYGAKRIGKTRSMEIMEALCFNSCSISSSSPAFMFRKIEWDRATLLWDEARFALKGQSTSKGEKMDMLKSGYKKIGRAGRCSGDGRTAAEYSTYGPKVFGNTVGFDNILADRSITLHLKRSGVQLPKFRMRKLNGEFSVLRNKLYIFGLDFAGKINDIYQNLEEIKGISDREEEIWSGPLSIARLIDAHSPGKSSTVFDELVSLAKDLKATKDIKDSDEDTDTLVLSRTYEYLLNPESARHVINGNLYNGEALCAHITSTSDIKLNNSQLGKILTKVHVIKEGYEEKKRMRVTDISGRRRQVMFYRLDKAKIETLARNHGIKVDPAQAMHSPCTLHREVNISS